MLKMSTLKSVAVIALVLTTIALTISIVSLITVLAQLKGTKAPTLTALDYAEIQQLNSRYPHALDTCADKGNEYAELFTADGVFTVNGKKSEGRESLAAVAGGPNCPRRKMNPLNMRHVIVNTVIAPSLEGATGKSYVLQVSFGEGGGKLIAGGKYSDVYVKTPEGWRFKSRTYESDHYIPNYYSEY
jgi:hypothetical protein